MNFDNYKIGCKVILLKREWPNSFVVEFLGITNEKYFYCKILEEDLERYINKYLSFNISRLHYSIPYTLEDWMKVKIDAF